MGTALGRPVVVPDVYSTLPSTNPSTGGRSKPAPSGASPMRSASSRAPSTGSSTLTTASTDSMPAVRATARSARSASVNTKRHREWLSTNSSSGSDHSGLMGTPARPMACIPSWDSMYSGRFLIHRQARSPNPRPNRVRSWWAMAPP